MLYGTKLPECLKGDASEGVKAMRLGSEGTQQTRTGKAVAFTKGTQGSRSESKTMKTHKPNEKIHTTNNGGITTPLG